MHLSFDWLGATMLALCGLPQAIKSCHTGKADDISWAFLVLWGGGELFMLIDRLPKQDWALIANYLCNLIFIVIILKYKLCPRSAND